MSPLRTQLDRQLAQKASQLEDANAAITELQADGRAAEAKIEVMRQQCSQLQEHVLRLQQDFTRYAAILQRLLQPVC